MSTIHFVPVRFIDTGATGTVPENNLAYFLARGYELITDEEVGQSPFPYVRSVAGLADIVTVEALLEALGTGIGEVSDAAVEALRAALVGGAPDLLNTLKELADALGDDPNFAATITALIGTKLDEAAVAAKIRLLLPDGLTYNTDGTVATSTLGGITTTYTYNTDGTINTEARDGRTKTYAYTAGVLTGSTVA